MNCYDPLLEYEKQCELHTKDTYTSNTNQTTSSQTEFIDLDQYCTANSGATFCTPKTKSSVPESNPESAGDAYISDATLTDTPAKTTDTLTSGSDELAYLSALRDELAQENAQQYTQPTKSAFSFSRFLWHWSRVAFVYFFLSGTIFGILMGIMNFSAYSARVVHWVQPEKIENLGQNMQKALVHNTPQAHAGEQEIPKQSEIQREVVEEKILIEYPDMVFDRSYDEENLLSGLSTTSASKASFSLVPKENRIIIPRIGKNIPLVDVEMRSGATYETMNDVFMEELKKGIVRYPGTAKPGQKGNAFIFGHSSNYPWIPSKYNNVFALLDKLQNGDEIIAYYDGKKYIYKVNDRAIVKPGDVKVLQSRDPNKKEIALMTCWPIGTTLERMIIFGELVEES